MIGTTCHSLAHVTLQLLGSSRTILSVSPNTLSFDMPQRYRIWFLFLLHRTLPLLCMVAPLHALAISLNATFRRSSLMCNTDLPLSTPISISAFCFFPPHHVIYSAIIWGITWLMSSSQNYQFCWSRDHTVFITVSLTPGIVTDV